MMEREKIEKLLRANGVSPASKDEEIRSVLLSARYNNDEVDTAVMVLRENVKTNKTRVDGLHKVFRSDRNLTAPEISALLGIDVDLEHKAVAGSKSREISTYSQIVLLVISFFVAMIGLMLYMFAFHIGLFHPSSVLAFKFLG